MRYEKTFYQPSKKLFPKVLSERTEYQYVQEKKSIIKNIKNII